MQAGAFTALAATARGGCASSSDQVQAAGIEAMPPPNSRSYRSTADYYSILNRGVTELSHNTPQTRRVLYDRARAVLATQLQGRDPVRIAHDQLCLERAILQMESFEQLAQDTVHPASQSDLALLVALKTLSAFLYSHSLNSFVRGVHFSSFLAARIIMIAACNCSKSNISGPLWCFSQSLSSLRALSHSFLSTFWTIVFRKNRNACEPLLSNIPSDGPAKVIATSNSPLANASIAASSAELHPRFL